MHSARNLYRLNLALAGLGTLVVLAGTGVALGHVELAPGPVDRLLSDCSRFLLPEVTPIGVILLGLGLLGTTVLTRGIGSLNRQVSGWRRLLRTLQIGSARVVATERVLIIDSVRMHAFCAGLVRPRIYLSAAAANQLTEAQLAAVVAHEAHHARRRDPLRILLLTVLGDALFFLPSLVRLRQRYVELAEIAADQAALDAVDDPSHLAAALLQFGDCEAPGVVGIDPERVDHLLGSAPSWEMPASVIASTLLTVAALLALVVTTAATAASQTSLAQLAAQSCMIAMTAGPVIALAGLTFVGRRTIARVR